MNVDLFDYDLPKELISQEPIKPRDHCKLLVYDRESKKIAHKKFFNILNLLNKDDVLVLNNTKVFPARLNGKKETGGMIEVFLLSPIDNIFNSESLNPRWNILVNKGINLNDKISFFKNKRKILEGVIKQKEGDIVIEFNKKEMGLIKAIYNLGEMPLPPYIKNHDKGDMKYYQTVYAKNLGSCAAPTAGFHFTNSLIKKLIEKGVKVEYITLNVGIGTFRPIKVDVVEQHKMDKEYFEIDDKTFQRLREYKENGKNIVAVGTTVVRTLESAHKDGELIVKNGFTDIFIYPGYEFKFISKFITNFHLPRSTPLMMVASFLMNNGEIEVAEAREDLMKIYSEAINKKYKFYSFGDAMFIQ